MPVMPPIPFEHAARPTRALRSAAQVRAVAVLALATCLLASGCATTPRIEPLKIEEVVQLSKDGVPPKDIIQRIDDRRTVFQLNGSQYAKLRAEGVDDEVLDHIQRTYVKAVEYESRIRGQQMYGPGWGPWGPWGPYGPGWRMGWGYW
jgi:hypothetical protein